MCFYTVDNVLSVALAGMLVHSGDYGEAMSRWYSAVIDATRMSLTAACSNNGSRATTPVPTTAGGNGSAMRVIPACVDFDNLDRY